MAAFSPNLETEIQVRSPGPAPMQNNSSSAAIGGFTQAIKILGSKFTLSLQTMIAAGTGLASLIGMWYALQADIQEAKELPVPLSLFSQEYPSKAEGYNWSPSYEQYKQQVGNLQDTQDEIYDAVEELQEEINNLKQQVIELRIKVK